MLAIILSVVLVLVGALLAIVLFRLDQATNLIQDQKDQLEQQKDLIDKKETFGTAMSQLLDTAQKFEGVKFGDAVPLDDYQALATRAWSHRWNAASVVQDTAQVTSDIQALDDLLASAAADAASNSTGSANEAVIDSLGGGFVTSVFDDVHTLCSADALGCVVSDNPYLVHFDAADNGLPWMNDTIRTGLAYHEFAHTLQFTNPAPTDVAVASFGGDVETMADCFALTFDDGWKLHHTIFTSSVEYYEVDVGYGYTCDESQRQVIRDWYAGLGIRVQPITQ
ncbi:hypothetical protein BH11ACT3_BH11ACT3_21750 [soil metagenome]